MFVNAKVIFNNEMFVGCFNEFRPINCDKITGTPRTAWLVRTDGELEYSIVFQQPIGQGALEGVWIGLDGQGMLVDGTVADFVAKCNSCCGDEPEVTPSYNGVFPDVVGPVAKEYTVTRTDAGTPTAINKFGLDYQKWIIPSSLYVSSRNTGTGVTTYKFKAYSDAIPQKFGATTDGVTQTALVFNSNVPGALTSGHHYHVEVFADGVRLGTGKDGAADGSLTTVVALLDADPVFSAKGDYALATDKISLTTTNVDSAIITITKVAP